MDQKIERAVSTCLTTTGTTTFVFQSTDHTDEPAVNTARELDWIHNGRGPLSALALRSAILEHVGSLQPGIRTFERLSSDPAASPAELAQWRQWVQRFVSRDAPFTMLVRSYFAHIDAVCALFD